MIKRFLFIFSLVTSLQLLALECENITFEWLLQEQNDDAVVHFRKLFNNLKIRTLIQCGCGYSTKYFVDNCERVVTIEFMATGVSDKYFIESLKLYKKCKNWFPLAFNADLKNESFNKACAYTCATHRNYGLIDPKYLYDLDVYFKKQIDTAHKKAKDVDVVFVKTLGVYIRGDIVNLFLARNVPIVVAYNTSNDIGNDVSEGVYGWYKVYTPFNYEKIFIPMGGGTTFWINKHYYDLIETMQRYRDLIVEMQANGTMSNDIDFLKALADSP